MNHHTAPLVFPQVTHTRFPLRECVLLLWRAMSPWHRASVALVLAIIFALGTVAGAALADKHAKARAGRIAYFLALKMRDTASR